MIELLTFSNRLWWYVMRKVPLSAVKVSLWPMRDCDRRREAVSSW